MSRGIGDSAHKQRPFFQQLDLSLQPEAGSDDAATQKLEVLEPHNKDSMDLFNSGGQQMAREYRKRVSRLVAGGAGYVQAKHALEGKNGIGRTLTTKEKSWLTEHIRLLTF